MIITFLHCPNTGDQDNSTPKNNWKLQPLTTHCNALQISGEKTHTIFYNNVLVLSLTKQFQPFGHCQSQQRIVKQCNNEF